MRWLPAKNHTAAPFEHEEYTIWLHNEIVEKIRYELWQFREQKSSSIKSSYAACNNILQLPSLQVAKQF